MTISERIFELIRERGYTQKEFSKRTGIAESTISDWKKKGTNPVSDKILIICKVLEVSPYFLLSGSEDPVVEKKVSEQKVSENKVSEKKAAERKNKPAAAVDKEAVRRKAREEKPAPEPLLPKIATISHDDDDYHIRPADVSDVKKDKKKDKDKDKEKKKDKKKEKNKDKNREPGKDKEKKKDKKKKKKGYLITY